MSLSKLVALASLLASVTAAQGPLVRLTLTARYPNGEPVVDLTRADLTVTDGNKPQRIVYFRSNRPSPPGLPLGPNVYSNRSAAQPHSLVILFDLLNETPPGRLEVWQSLRRSIPHLESEDAPYLYLLTLDGNLAPVHAIAGKSGQPLDKAMQFASRAPDAPLSWGDVVAKSYLALETLASELADLPGARDIIWITGGMPHIPNSKTPCAGDWVNCSVYVPQLSVALTRAGVRVDPVSYSSNPLLKKETELFASLTGGRAFLGEQITSDIRQLTRDTMDSYSLAYDPSPANWDSKFHTIRVTTDRAGITLDAQQRYYAELDPRPAAARQKAALHAAFQSPVDLPGIGLRVTVAQRTPKTVRFQILIPAADLMLREDGDTFSARMTLAFSDLAEHGPPSEPALSNFDLRLTREQRDLILQSGILLAPDHPVPNLTQRVRIFVLDRVTDVVGSITVPVAGAPK
jgi:VWFA-related protein